MNKYLQHILRKTNKTDPIPKCIEELRRKKDQELKTYLWLVQKRLRLQCHVTKS